jgi:hypothetical protein
MRWGCAYRTVDMNRTVCEGIMSIRDVARRMKWNWAAVNGKFAQLAPADLLYGHRDIPCSWHDAVHLQFPLILS